MAARSPYTGSTAGRYKVVQCGIYAGELELAYTRVNNLYWLTHMQILVSIMTPKLSGHLKYADKIYQFDQVAYYNGIETFPAKKTNRYAVDYATLFENTSAQLVESL